MKAKILLGVVFMNILCAGIYLFMNPSPVEAGDQKGNTKIQELQQPQIMTPGEQMEVLRQREERVKNREMELKELETHVTERIKKLEAIEASVRNELQSYKLVSGERVKHLVKIYSSMKPKAAATLMNNCELDIAVEVFLNMKGDIAGGILAYMEPQKAATITQRLMTFRGGNTASTPSAESATAMK
jgi:flagellar motility protein MotE (MotC chaperone)